MSLSLPERWSAAVGAAGGAARGGSGAGRFFKKGFLIGLGPLCPSPVLTHHVRRGNRGRPGEREESEVAGHSLRGTARGGVRAAVAVWPGGPPWRLCCAGLGGAVGMSVWGSWSCRCAEAAPGLRGTRPVALSGPLGPAGPSAAPRSLPLPPSTPLPRNAGLCRQPSAARGERERGAAPSGRPGKTGSTPQTMAVSALAFLVSRPEFTSGWTMDTPVRFYPPRSFIRGR